MSHPCSLCCSIFNTKDKKAQSYSLCSVYALPTKGLLLKHLHLAHKKTNTRQLTFEDLLMVFVSSVRSSNSHPDLLLIHHPLFQITPVLNTGLSLSEPLELYKGYNAKYSNIAIKRQSLDSMCWLLGCLMGSTGHH